MTAINTKAETCNVEAIAIGDTKVTALALTRLLIFDVLKLTDDFFNFVCYKTVSH